jgi:SpoVK/Ycf46/Vps4 family AAA+-type ATPase
MPKYRRLVGKVQMCLCEYMTSTNQNSLVFDDDIKHRLLHFMSTIMLFSDRQVNNKIVSWNRIILLHGPPGTGKTSLCKAEAQKLTIRLSKNFVDGKLVEISAHSLFSKWFSESGKLVGKLFAHIREMMKDERTLICVLIGSCVLIWYPLLKV